LVEVGLGMSVWEEALIQLFDNLSIPPTAVCAGLQWLSLVQVRRKVVQVKLFRRTGT
jgi:hypothetical protein